MAISSIEYSPDLTLESTSNLSLPFTSAASSISWAFFSFKYSWGSILVTGGASVLVTFFSVFSGTAFCISSLVFLICSFLTTVMGWHVVSAHLMILFPLSSL